MILMGNAASRESRNDETLRPGQAAGGVAQGARSAGAVRAATIAVAAAAAALVLTGCGMQPGLPSSDAAPVAEDV